MKGTLWHSSCRKAGPSDLLAASNTSCPFDSIDAYLRSQSSASPALCNISHLFFRAPVIRKPGRVKKGLIDHKVLSNVKAGPGWPPIYSELLWFNLQTGCFSRLWVLSATHVSALRYDLLHAPFISFEGRKLNWRVEEGNCSKYTHINWRFLCGCIIGVWTTIKNYIKMKLIFTAPKWFRTLPPTTPFVYSFL